MATTKDQPLEPGEVFDPRFKRDMTLGQRMHLVMTRVNYIQKDKPKAAEPGGKQLRYSIVSHDAVTALIRENTVACGLIYYPLGGSMKVERDGNLTQVQLVIRFQSIDDSEDVIDVDGLGYGIDTGDKGPGKAISYAVKYALLKAFGLETGDDPDLDQEVQRRSTTQQRADELIKALAVADRATFYEIATSPATAAIAEALRRDDLAAFRTVNQQIVQLARAANLDLSKPLEEQAQ